MQGACSNQIVKCIIYTNNANVGINKLLEIENDKNKSGIKTIFKRIFKKSPSFIDSEIRFDDGEEWTIVNPNAGARGYRWRKAWVDGNNTTVSQLYSNIIPYGDGYRWEEHRIFNFKK